MSRLCVDVLKEEHWIYYSYFRVMITYKTKNKYIRYIIPILWISIQVTAACYFTSGKEGTRKFERILSNTSVFITEAIILALNTKIAGMNKHYIPLPACQLLLSVLFILMVVIEYSLIRYLYISELFSQRIIITYMQILRNCFFQNQCEIIVNFILMMISCILSGKLPFSRR